jgi:hypothetical protein
MASAFKPAPNQPPEGPERVMVAVWSLRSRSRAKVTLTVDVTWGGTGGREVMGRGRGESAGKVVNSWWR